MKQQEEGEEGCQCEEEELKREQGQAKKAVRNNPEFKGLVLSIKKNKRLSVF